MYTGSILLVKNAERKKRMKRSKTLYQQHRHIESRNSTKEYVERLKTVIPI